MRDRLADLLKKADENCERKCITDYEDAILDNADYLIENGVIALSVTSGQTVYIKGRPLIVSFIVIEDKSITYVVQFDCDDCGDCPFYEDEVSFQGEHDCKTNGYLEFNDSDIGKTVFLTKEEAEKALRGEGE